MLDTILSIADGAIRARTAEDASAALCDALLPRGLSYLQVRNYHRPRGRLTSAAHWAAGGVLARHVRPGWIGSASSNYVCFEQNPLLRPIATGRTRYRFSSYAPHGDKRFASYWEAMSEGGIGDALCATAYGEDGTIASLHIGFDDAALPAAFAEAVQSAGSIVAERLLAFAAPETPDRPALTARERDAISYVAEGKTDWEIGTILGLSEATARFHVDNARRKLGAVNRAQAVACYIAANGFV
ncbi:HTH luxR-type domain-containing protein [Sphingomonas antarctica]|uniref:helix-turn-helix domain-containing protein n=1 Tax=Sphingomonas antarctica TaxID=2040274 RepID=UPI0039EC73BB